MRNNSPFPYEDILHLSRPATPRQAEITKQARASQFSPFAALRGFDHVLAEIERDTQQRRELTEEEKEKLNRQLQFLDSLFQPTVTVTYFQPDATKSGGAYLTVSGTLKKIDAYRQTLVLTEGQVIPIGEIFALNSDCFGE